MFKVGIRALAIGLLLVILSGRLHPESITNLTDTPIVVWWSSPQISKEIPGGVLPQATATFNTGPYTKGINSLYVSPGFINANRACEEIPGATKFAARLMGGQIPAKAAWKVTKNAQGKLQLTSNQSTAPAKPAPTTAATPQPAAHSAQAVPSAR